MEELPIADVIELQQLLARYAVGMTRDDVESVMEVFTPDGTYSAFGDTYPLADFPTLVAAAPKGLFMVGPPVLDLHGDEGTGQQPLCFVDQTDPRHAHRLLHRHLPTHRAGLATADQVHDLPAQERGPGLRAGPRPDPALSHRRLMELAAFRSALDAWLDEHEAELTPTPGAAESLDDQMDHLAMVKRLTYEAGWMRWGWPDAGRRARGVDAAARLPGRGPHLAGPGGAGHLLDDRGAGAHHDRLRRTRAGRRHGAAAAAR